MCRPAGASSRGWLCIGFDASQLGLMREPGVRAVLGHPLRNHTSAALPLHIAHQHTGTKPLVLPGEQNMQPPPRSQKQLQIELTTSRTPHRAPRNSYKHKDRGRQRQRKRRNMAADTAFLLNIKKSQNPSKLEPKNVHRSRKHSPERAQPSSGALFGERFDS